MAYRSFTVGCRPGYMVVTLAQVSLHRKAGGRRATPNSARISQLIAILQSRFFEARGDSD
jgi:hypothetical protein